MNNESLIHTVVSIINSILLPSYDMLVSIYFVMQRFASVSIYIAATSASSNGGNGLNRLRVRVSPTVASSDPDSTFILRSASHYTHPSSAERMHQ